MILFRCFAWSRRARAHERNGALWIPRELQGEGRHDNPDAYGCLYATDRATSAVVQQLALALFRARPRAAALRWWSTFEALWANYTLFDRVAVSLRVADVHRL